MKKLILITLLLLVTLQVQATPADDYWKARTYLGAQNRNLDPLYKHITDFYSAQNASGGDIFYVDGNKVTAGDGSTWDKAFNTLSAAMLASHTDIAVTADRQWASRNIIYVRGDMIDEDITALAQKTDIIGVGSNDYTPRAGISGNWTIAATTNYQGCRFFGMDFSDTAAGGILFAIDGQAGFEFHDCTFDGNATDTIGLNITSSNFWVVDNCRFGVESGAGKGFTTAAINISSDDPIYSARISNNYISGEIGVDWNETTINNCRIDNNVFNVTSDFVDSDDLAGLIVSRNVVITQAAPTDNNGWDIDLNWAVNNYVTGQTDSHEVPSIAD